MSVLTQTRQAAHSDVVVLRSPLATDAHEPATVRDATLLAVAL